MRPSTGFYGHLFMVLAIYGQTMDGAADRDVVGWPGGKYYLNTSGSAIWRLVP
jgi:hypothetical protein